MSSIRAGRDCARGRDRRSSMLRGKVSVGSDANQEVAKSYNLTTAIKPGLADVRSVTIDQDFIERETHNAVR